MFYSYVSAKQKVQHITDLETSDCMVNLGYKTSVFCSNL